MGSILVFAVSHLHCLFGRRQLITSAGAVSESEKQSMVVMISEPVKAVLFRDEGQPSAPERVCPRTGCSIGFSRSKRQFRLLIVGHRQKGGARLILQGRRRSAADCHLRSLSAFRLKQL
jgi:hypothetical protein